MYLWGDCDYIADCIHDFNDHTHSPDEENENSLFTCNFCDERFETLPEVMIHNKAIHTGSVQHCEKYLENDCFFGKSCWFLDSESFKNSDPSFECNFCKEKFRTQNAFREHMKKLYFEKVSNCKNENECKFGPRKCWFIHQEIINIAYQNAESQGQIDYNNI